MNTGANGQKACILRTDEKHDAIWHHGAGKGLKNWMMGIKPHKKKTVSVNFNHTPFSVSFNHDAFEMQALVWLCMVQFRVICFSTS